MKLMDFMKDKWLFCVLQGIVILFIGTFLSVMRLNSYGIAFVVFAMVILDGLLLMGEYIQKRMYYKRLLEIRNKLDRKHLMSELLDKPNFEEGKIWWETFKIGSKAMNDEIAMHRLLQEEYKAYIEAWIHEIKTPLASIELMCENEKTPLANHMRMETQKVESFVEQALFYARSTSLEKDYSIRKVNLETLVKNTIKKYARQMIEVKVKLELEELNYQVLADPKWIEFILGQLISNSLKYRKDSLVLKWYGTESPTQVILTLEDNGIGIPTKDIGRVFYKGFTGENGRYYGKSTGIGLYLCKKLCKKMHLGIEIESREGVGTKVMLIFPKDQTIFLE